MAYILNYFYTKIIKQYNISISQYLYYLNYIQTNSQQIGDTLADLFTKTFFH